MTSGLLLVRYSGKAAWHVSCSRHDTILGGNRRIWHGISKPSEGHFRVKTIMAAILKGRSKPKCSKLATSKGPSAWRISKGTTDGHFGPPWSFWADCFHDDGAFLWAWDDDAEGHFKKQLFGPLHPEASCPFVPPQIFEPSGFWMQLPKDKK